MQYICQGDWIIYGGKLLPRQPAGSQVSQRGSIFIGSFRVAMMLIAGTWTLRCRGNGISGQVCADLSPRFSLLSSQGLTFPGLACSTFLREKNYSQGPVSVSVRVSVLACVCMWVCSYACPHAWIRKPLIWWTELLFTRPLSEPPWRFR